MAFHRFHIVDTTLREGEQWANAHFTSAQRAAIATQLDQFGVEYLELTSPCASPQSASDLRTIAALPLQNARVLTHTRCHLPDVRLAADCGVAGVNVLFGTSPQLREWSHGRSLEQILDQAIPVIRLLRDRNLEVRFSCEDAFRTPLPDLLRIYQAVDLLGVDRIGIADTVGIATPREVERVVGAVRNAVRCDIEFHGHNDGGCAVANTYAALEAGATHLNTTVLGIGERNGIAALSGLIARLYLTDPSSVERYSLQRLAELDHSVAAMLGIAVPFNACITSATAFAHKAGLHTKAVLANPASYEAIDPAAFGRERDVLIGHRLTGRHALQSRARALGLALSDTTIGKIASQLKNQADDRPLTLAEVDGLLCDGALQAA